MKNSLLYYRTVTNELGNAHNIYDTSVSQFTRQNASIFLFNQQMSLHFFLDSKCKNSTQVRLLYW